MTEVRMMAFPVSKNVRLIAKKKFFSSIKFQSKPGHEVNRVIDRYPKRNCKENRCRQFEINTQQIHQTKHPNERDNIWN